jgi:hypothetical protein
VDAIDCQRCGRRAAPDEDVRLSWVMDRGSRGVQWTCPSCAADNVRSMEAKLDIEWW